MNKGILSVLVLFFMLTSCLSTRNVIQIDDYILVTTNGKDVYETKNITAFVFENNLRNLPFDQFVTNKFSLAGYHTREFWVTIDSNRYKIIMYDNAEVEKFIDTSKFMVSTEETQDMKIGSQGKFVAVSMLNASNEDCLAEGSLYENIAIKFLKNLKDEYLRYK